MLDLDEVVALSGKVRRVEGRVQRACINIVAGLENGRAI